MNTVETRRKEDKKKIKTEGKNSVFFLNHLN